MTLSGSTQIKRLKQTKMGSSTMAAERLVQLVKVTQAKRTRTQTTARMSLKVSPAAIHCIATDNERKHMLGSPYTVFPESSGKTAWDCAGFIFIVIQSI